jgi:isopropylmalate/homocitrate/citramalate synthase
MEKLGIDRVDLGLPGAGPQHREHIEALLQVIVSEKMRIKPGCAVRTVVSDIEPIDALQQKFGIKIQASAFLGTSPIRQYAEGWTLQKLMETMEVAVKWAIDHKIPVMFVTEDTTRSKPADVKALYQRAIELGAGNICVCDTCGHVTPHGVKQLLRFVIEDVVKPTGKQVLVNWHGHSDRGLAVANSLAAIEAGADVVHGTALGLGERVGNCQIDQLLVNLKLMGLIKNDLSALAEYVKKAHEYTGVPLAPELPRLRRRRLRNGHGCPCRSSHQGQEKRRQLACGSRVLWCARRRLRLKTNYPHRPHERQEQRGFLVRTARLRAHRRTRRKNPKRRQSSVAASDG